MCVGPPTLLPKLCTTIYVLAVVLPARPSGPSPGQLTYEVVSSGSLMRLSNAPCPALY
jgi:hypothetical protein